jgi:type IV secretion system protein VirD4
MNATKILWSQVLLVSAVALAFVWGATEWVARRLAFQPQLGRPWVKLLGWAVHQPTTFFWWWLAYDAYARDISGGYFAASGGFAAIIIAIAMPFRRLGEARRIRTHGSARRAESREIRKAGFLRTDCVLHGRWRYEYVSTGQRSEPAPALAAHSI